jgi:hypothetical protein
MNKNKWKDPSSPGPSADSRVGPLGMSVPYCASLSLFPLPLPYSCTWVCAWLFVGACGGSIAPKQEGGLHVHRACSWGFTDRLKP